MKPRDALPQTAAAAALAVLRGARTVREVAAACGWASSQTAWWALVRARHHGLVDWEPAHAGTIHPTTEVVANTPRGTP